jgi:hypothetical protein
MRLDKREERENWNNKHLMLNITVETEKMLSQIAVGFLSLALT